MQTDTRPWYKEPYVWMLIGVPLSSVIVGSFFIFLAASSKDSLVRDNYYKDGMAINQLLQWEKKAKSLDIKLSFKVDGNNASVSILNSRQTPPNTLTLKLSHPTLKEKDRDVFLQHSKDGEFIGFIDSLENSRFYVMVESPEQMWRVKQSIEVIQGKVLEL